MNVCGITLGERDIRRLKNLSGLLNDKVCSGLVEVIMNNIIWFLVLFLDYCGILVTGCEESYFGGGTVICTSVV